MKAIHWGILGAGSIAHAFAQGLGWVADAQLVAVGSRSAESAESFGKKYNIPNRHASYAALIADPQVDIIYIATPHNLHYENTMACLAGGKHVLCEKPIAVNAAQAREMFRFAQQKGLFLMEALWTRFLPVTQQAIQLAQKGSLGDIRLFQADFGFRSAWKPEKRLLNPALAGGALLDVGIYPLFWTCLLMGEPLEVQGFADLGKTGVDENSIAIFRFAEGRLGMLASSVRTSFPTHATLYGTRGRLHLNAPIYRPDGLKLVKTTDPDAGLAGGKLSQDKAKSFLRTQRWAVWLYTKFWSRLRAVAEGENAQTIPSGLQGNGYQYEAIEAGLCVRAGQIESAQMPASRTLLQMDIMDELRHQWGLVYPPAVEGL
jgi:predicted dehydrogenase